MVAEMEAFNKVLHKYDVTIYRPELIMIIIRYLQEIGFVIDGILSNQTFYRNARELDAIQYVIDQIDLKVVRPPEGFISRGDVMLGRPYIYRYLQRK
jgi:hypothetical protein